MPDREEKAEQLRKELLDEDNYNRPTTVSYTHLTLPTIVGV